ncbi:uncharacterized protein FYW23_007504 isoform 1-T3 [Sylvia borin]
MNGSAGDSRATLPSQIRIQTNIPWHTRGLRERPQRGPVSSHINTERKELELPGAAPGFLPQTLPSGSAPPRHRTRLQLQVPGSRRAGQEGRRDDKELDCWAGAGSHNRGGVCRGVGTNSRGFSGTLCRPTPPRRSGNDNGGHGGESRQRPGRAGRRDLRPAGPAESQCVGEGPTGAAIRSPSCLLRGAAPSAAPAGPGCAPLALPRSAAVPAHGASPSPAHRRLIPHRSILRAPGACPGYREHLGLLHNRSVPRAPGASSTPWLREHPPSRRSVPSPFSTGASGAPKHREHPPNTGSTHSPSALRASPGTGSLRSLCAPRASPEHRENSKPRLSRQPPRAAAASPSPFPAADGTYRPEVWRRREDPLHPEGDGEKKSHLVLRQG